MLKFLTHSAIFILSLEIAYLYSSLVHCVIWYGNIGTFRHLMLVILPTQSFLGTSIMFILQSLYTKPISFLLSSNYFIKTGRISLLRVLIVEKVYSHWQDAVTRLVFSRIFRTAHSPHSPKHRLVTIIQKMFYFAFGPRACPDAKGASVVKHRTCAVVRALTLSYVDKTEPGMLSGTRKPTEQLLADSGTSGPEFRTFSTELQDQVGL